MFAVHLQKLVQDGHLLTVGAAWSLISRGVETSRVPTPVVRDWSKEDTPAAGVTARAQVLERGYRGLVAKDEGSVYVGGRTRAWLKVKQANWTDGEHRWRRTHPDRV